MTGTMKTLTRATCQLATKAMIIPVTNELIAWKVSPITVLVRALTLAASVASVVLRIPEEFSVRSCHAMFILRNLLNTRTLSLFVKLSASTAKNQNWKRYKKNIKNATTRNISE